MIAALLLAVAVAANPFIGGVEPAPGPVVHGEQRGDQRTVRQLPMATGELSTPHFRLVHTAKSEGAAKKLAEEIEPIRARLVEVLGRDWPGITEVRIGHGREEYEALAIPGAPPPSWAVALAYPLENIVLVDAHSLVMADGQQTLRHELLHAALGQLGGRWPRWFQEGVAQQVTGERAFSQAQYAALARAVNTNRVFRIEDLADGFPELPSDVEIAYAESAAFVSFLRERHGPAAFRALVDDVTAGYPFETAFARAFHTSLMLEEKAFLLDLPKRYPIWPVMLDGTGPWALLGLLVVFGWWRRRKYVVALRAEQAAQEAAEDAAARILAAEEAARQVQMMGLIAPLPAENVLLPAPHEPLPETPPDAPPPPSDDSPKSTH